MRGDFLGIISSHTKGHFVRAVLEGVAFSLFDCLIKEEALGVQAKEFRLIGGGAKSRIWQRIMADVFGQEMRIPQESDASFGTALLGGVGIGVFASLEEAVERCVRIQETIEPNRSNHKIYQEIFECYQTSEAALKETYRHLYDINLPVI